MSLFFASIRYFKCLVRREYTRDLVDGQGEFLGAYAIGVECRRGRMLGFQVLFDGTDGRGAPVHTGGGMYRVPLEAVVTQPCNPVLPSVLAPWDCLSDEFSVVTLEMIQGMRAYVLPKRIPGRYRFTVHYARSDLTDDPEQTKQHHVIETDEGWLAAVPNSRVLLEDPAFFMATTERPDFAVLSHTFSAE